MGAFFRAAAALFRAKPWQHVPDDESVFSVTIEQLGVCDVAMSVIGHIEQSFGLILFSDLDDLDGCFDAAEVIESGQKPEMPPTRTPLRPWT